MEKEKPLILVSNDDGVMAKIIKEIQKEYHKEFISEGVMFYYYKRTGCKSIPNYSEEMTDTQYLLPYPTFEIQSGRVQ